MFPQDESVTVESRPADTLGATLAPTPEQTLLLPSLLQQQQVVEQLQIEQQPLQLSQPPLPQFPLPQPQRVHQGFHCSHEPSQPSVAEQQHLSIFFTGPPGSGKTTQIDLLKKFFSQLPVPLHVIIGKQLKKEGEKMFGNESGVSPASYLLPNGKPFSTVLDSNSSSSDKSNSSNNSSSRSSSSSSSNSSSLGDEVKQLMGINKFNSCLMLHRRVAKIAKESLGKPFVYIFSRGPANAAYARILNDFLDIRPDVYFVLESDDEQMLLNRITNRRFDPEKCITYNLSDGHQEPNRIAALFKRSGDTPQNFPKRMKKYRERSASTLNWYQTHFNGLPIVRMAANRTREDIHQEIVLTLLTLLKRKLNFSM